MKKNGFTLIELLAVIVILAIIALIATPIIMGIINEVNEQSIVRSVQNIQDGAETFIISEKTLNPDYVFNQSDFKYSGKQYEDIAISTNEKDQASVAVYENDKCYYILAGTTEVKVEELTKEECLAKVGGSSPVAEPESFATDSWETIASAVSSGQTDNYNVGDTKEVEVTGYGTFTVRIANKSTPSECNTSGFSETACGFVVEFVDVITTYNMNSTNTNVGGWPGSAMYSFVNDTIYNALPEDLRNVIADTYVVSSHGPNDSTNLTSTDKLYLLSTKEVWRKSGTSNTINYDTAEAETRQLDYYTNLGVSTSNDSGAIKYDASGTATIWWLRSATSTTSSNFYSVITSGDWNNNNANNTNGCCPDFCNKAEQVKEKCFIYNFLYCF